MDPTANVAEMRRLADRLANTEQLPEDAARDGVRLADLMIALDEWLSKGNFLPAQWNQCGP